MGILCGIVLWLNYDTIPKVNIVAFKFTSALVFCWLIGGAARGFGGALLEFTPLIYLGRISYGLYLYHLFMPSVVGPLSRRLGIDYWDGGLLNLALSSGAALIVAALSWHLLEAPISNLRHRFRPECSRTASPTG